MSAGEELNGRAVPDLPAVEVAAMVGGVGPVLVAEMLLSNRLNKLLMSRAHDARMRRHAGEADRSRHQKQ